MALNQGDFLLTDEELREINRYFTAAAEAQAKSSEDAPQNVSVTFEFIPALGRRTVIAHFDGAPNGQRISDECLIEEAATLNAEAKNSTDNESGEQRLAKHGFFLSEDIQGTPEADKLANTLADICKSMREG